MTTLNLSLPASIESFLEQQVSQGGYETVNEYILDLITQEQARVKRIEDLLLEGLDSGEPIEVTDQWWEEKREFLQQKLDNYQ